MAGTGKSTIARTVARRYLDEERLAATFFFSRGGGDVGHAGKFVTSIAIQLAHSVPAAGRHIGEAVAKRSNIASQSLRDQWEQLIIHPLCRLDVTTKALETYVVVVDALDECDNDSNIGMIVELLAEARPLMATRLRVLLTSRPEVPIRHGFGQVSEVEHVNVVLHDIERSIVDQDICTFLEDRLQSVRRERGLQVDWPGRRVITQLVQHASGLFIWAATACRFIRDGKRFAAKRLEMIMSTGNESRTATAPEKRLDQIYVTVLQNSVSEDFTDEERDEQYEMLKYVLGGIVMLSIPLSERSLSALLGIADEDVRQTLTDLHAILHIPKDPTQRLRLHHPSFRDFLLNTDRCGVDFWVNKRMIHEKLAFGCIQLMSGPNGLRQNICGLSELGSLRSEMGKETSAVHLSPELSYACWRWVEHLDSSNLSIVDGDTVHLFLRTHLLHWLEAMIFLGGMDPAYIGSSKCLHSLDLLESLVRARSHAWKSYSYCLLTHDIVSFRHVCRLPPRCTKVCEEIHQAAEGNTIATLCFSAHLRTRIKLGKTKFRQTGSTGSKHTVGQRPRLGCRPRCIRRPYTICICSCIFTRRKAACVSISRYDSASVGDSNRNMSTRTKGSYGLGHCNSILTRRAANCIRICRFDSADVGDSKRNMSAHANET